MTLRPRTTLRRGKGQPEGSAVTGKARKPRVAEPGLVSEEAAGQNNSSLLGRNGEGIEFLTEFET
jgi:hypothetical protein